MEIFGSNEVVVGENSNMQDTLFNSSCGQIKVGNNCFTGHRVMILTGTHDIKKVGEDRMNSWIQYQNNHIDIKDGVWIGSGAIVLGPCTIGKNSVIAAGSIVLPGVYPENVLIAGNPGTIKKIIVN